jgi:hypothetical protein
MLSSARLEARTAALGALRKLSTHRGNRGAMTDAGVVPALLHLLFSVTSVSVNLKEAAAATLANLAAVEPDAERLRKPQRRRSGDAVDSRNVADPGQPPGSALHSDETISQLLSLLNLVGPAVQEQLLRALRGLATSTAARARLREAGAYQLLLPLCEAGDAEVRANAAVLLDEVSEEEEGIEERFAELFGHTYASALVRLLASERGEERAAAAGVVGKLPESDSRLTGMLSAADALTPLLDNLRLATAEPGGSSRPSFAPSPKLLEATCRALRRFALPSNVTLQRSVAERGAIPLLVRALAAGSRTARREAALVLGRLSESTPKLAVPIEGKEPGCILCFFRVRLAHKKAAAAGCRVHAGKCSTAGSFCLVEAGAIGPLVRALGDDDDDDVDDDDDHEDAGRKNDDVDGAAVATQEALLRALCTLLKDEIWEKGVDAIADAGGLPPIVRLLSARSPQVAERAAWMLERFFRSDKYCAEFGAHAQMPLIDLTLKGSPAARSLAARCLAHLQILHNQSTYF